jgi:membrane carboxypeptidase/penicillin-binding protein
MPTLPDLGRRGEGWVAIQFALLLPLALAGVLGPAWDGPLRMMTSLIGSAALVVGAILAILGARDKTGTTQKGRDNWFNGFTSNLVASVWVGFDNDQSLGAGAEGSTTAVPIWMHFMREALRGVPSSRPPRPDGLVDLRVSPSTGARAHPFDPTAITETFMLDPLPPAPRPGETWVEPGAAGPASSNPF